MNFLNPIKLAPPSGPGLSGDAPVPVFGSDGCPSKTNLAKLYKDDVLEGPTAESVAQRIFDDATDAVLAINALPVAERPPADKLTDEQKCAFFVLAGFMRFENGKLRSIRPVGISDDGKGGYIVGIARETPKMPI